MSQPGNTTPELRRFLARILGWSDKGAVDHALRSIQLSITHQAALVLLGDTDLVPIAFALHRRTRGDDCPFVVCDPRRPSGRASVRAPASYASGVTAFRAALGGSLCMRLRRMPQDFPATISLVRDPAAPVQFVLLADAQRDVHPFLTLPMPIQVPPLGTRTSELPRIVDEYTADAIDALRADVIGLPDIDRAWVLKHAVGSLGQIEKATLRLVALRSSGTIEQAARRLGMSGGSLRGWIRCRSLNHRG
jgi:hypothetical protein